MSLSLSHAVPSLLRLVVFIILTQTNRIPGCFSTWMLAGLALVIWWRVPVANRQKMDNALLRLFLLMVYLSHSCSQSFIRLSLSLYVSFYLCLHPSLEIRNPNWWYFAMICFSWEVTRQRRTQARAIRPNCRCVFVSSMRLLICTEHIFILRKICGWCMNVSTFVRASRESCFVTWDYNAYGDTMNEMPGEWEHTRRPIVEFYVFAETLICGVN